MFLHWLVCIEVHPICDWSDLSDLCSPSASARATWRLWWGLRNRSPRFNGGRWWMDTPFTAARRQPSRQVRPSNHASYRLQTLGRYQRRYQWWTSTYRRGSCRMAQCSDGLWSSRLLPKYRKFLATFGPLHPDRWSRFTSVFYSI